MDGDRSFSEWKNKQKHPELIHHWGSAFSLNALLCHLRVFKFIVNYFSANATVPFPVSSNSFWPQFSPFADVILPFVRRAIWFTHLCFRRWWADFVIILFPNIFEGPQIHCHLYVRKFDHFSVVTGEKIKRNKTLLSALISLSCHNKGVNFW